MPFTLAANRLARSRSRPKPRPAPHRLRLGTLEDRVVPDFGPVGAEFRVNTHTAEAQTAQAVAVDAAGNFVVVWASFLQDGSSWGIFGQQYDADGVAQGPEFPVNTTAASAQDLPAVAMDADGNFVVAWATFDQDGDGRGVFGRRFDAAGVPLGDEFQVNTYTPNTQWYPAVAMNAAGQFVIAWESFGQDGDSFGVYAQPYGAAGAPVGAEIPVNTTTAGSQDTATVAIGADGGFVVSWTSDGQDGSGYGVYARRFDPAGEPVSGELPVNATTAGDQFGSRVAVDGSGGVVATWTSRDQDGGGEGVYARRFDAAGGPLGDEFRVNATTAGDQWGQAVAVCPDGRSLVTWESADQDGSVSGVYAQQYSPAGEPVGSEFRVNTYTTDQQGYFPVVAADGAGRAVVAWSSLGQDGSDYGVYAQRYLDDTPPNQPPTLDGVPGSATFDERTEFTFTAGATDPDGPSAPRFSLGGAPAGATIDPDTGAFTWTPTEAQGPGTFTFRVRVSDGWNVTSAPVTLTVREVNAAPTLTGVPTQATIDELAPYAFTAGSTDPDLPTQSLTFSLVGAPAGADIDPATGAFTWTPTEAQGPAEYGFTVRVSDGVTATDAPVTLTVREVNAAPVLTVPAAAAAVPGATLTFTATATDPDVPAQALTFSLVGAPAGAGIDPATGAFTWTPGPDVALGDYPFQVRVEDTAIPAGTDTRSVTVTVARAGIVGGDLAVAGTAGNDVVTVLPAADPAELAVTVNGVSAGVFPRAAVTGRIVARGFDGNDKVTVGPTVSVGADLWGGAGKDTLTGGAGPDSLVGGAGNDRLIGGKGDDRYVVDDAWGLDTITETATGGVDTLDLSAVPAGLTIRVGGVVKATAGTNAISGLRLENVLGGAGDDTFQFAAGGKVAGTLDGGPGTNALNYAAYLTPVVVNLGLGTATGTGGVANVRNVAGGAASDTLVGDGQANTLTGNGGRDILIGTGGADALVGGGGDDLLLGGLTTHAGDPAALTAIRREWVRAVPYTTRVGHLLGTVPAGLNGTVLLDAASLSDDGQADTFTGGAGRDWFLTAGAEAPTDLQPGETVTTH